MEKADASDACVALIDESSRRWREAEGNYRDDITAIVCHLPMVGAPDQMSASAVAAKSPGQTHGTPTNSFKVAPSSRKNSFEDLSTSTSPPKPPEPPAVAEGAEAEEALDTTGFAKRRLSVQGQVEEDDVTEEKLAELRAEFGGKAP